MNSKQRAWTVLAPVSDGAAVRCQPGCGPVNITWGWQARLQGAHFTRPARWRKVSAQVVCPHSMESGEASSTSHLTCLKKQLGSFKYCGRRWCWTRRRTRHRQTDVHLSTRESLADSRTLKSKWADLRGFLIVGDTEIGVGGLRMLEREGDCLDLSPISVPCWLCNP